MPRPASRSVVIISGLLTLLVLGGGTLAVGFHNGWLQTASDSPGHETAAASAYAQIRSLQSPQPSSPPHGMRMKGSASTMAMTIVVDADRTDAVHTMSDQRQAATPCRGRFR
jgi:hypothetical protein